MIYASGSTDRPRRLGVFRVDINNCALPNKITNRNSIEVKYYFYTIILHIIAN